MTDAMTQQRISDDAPADGWRSRDIVEELREPPNWTAHYDSTNEVRPQKDMPSAWPYAAADEIERLRALLFQKDAEIAALKAELEPFQTRFAQLCDGVRVQPPAPFEPKVKPMTEPVDPVDLLIEGLRQRYVIIDRSVAMQAYGVVEAAGFRIVGGPVTKEMLIAGGGHSQEVMFERMVAAAPLYGR